MEAQEIYDRLWAGKYAPLYAAERAAEERRRAEAFLDVPRDVAGFPLRPLTPRDLHLLDGAGCPFASGDPLSATPPQLWRTLWFLRAGPAPLFAHYARTRQIKRWRRAHLDAKGQPTAAFYEARVALKLYFAEAQADLALPRPADADAGPRRPPATHWLAPLLVDLAQALGPVDPLGGRPWGSVPIAQLAQYRRELAGAHRKITDPGRSNQLRSQCLAETNAILRA